MADISDDVQRSPLDDGRRGSTADSAQVTVRRHGSPVAGVILAALLFLGASLLLFGLRVVDDYTHSYIGGNGPDPKLFIWSMRWWSGPAFGLRNPFHADTIWAPYGYDLSWATTVPGPAVLAAPLTRVAGPIASFNTLMLAAPVLAATATFVLCIRITKRFWPSIAGGFSFGFSSYMLAHLRGGHLNLLLTFPIPLIAVTVFVALTRGMSRRRLVLCLLALYTALFAISTELFATTTGMTALALMLAYIVADRGLRLSIKRVLPSILLGYGLALLAVSPVLVAAFVGSIPVQIIDVSAGSTDLLNLVVPTSVTWIRWGTLGISNEFAGAVSGQGAYVGIALLVVGAITVWQQRRLFAGKFLALFVVTSFLMSLGPTLRIAGTASGIPTPGSLLKLVPLVEKAHPGRLFMFASLGIAVLVAVFLSSTKGRHWRWALVIVGFGLLLPAPRGWIWRTTPETPAFFAQPDLRSILDQGENVLVLSRTSALALVWHANAEMEFSMPTAYTGGIPTGSHPAATERFLYRQQCPVGTLPSAFWETLESWGVRRIIAAGAGRESASCPVPLIESSSVESLGGVSIYTRVR